MLYLSTSIMLKEIADAHSLEELNNIVYGIGIVKKVLLRKENLLNTMTKEKYYKKTGG